MAFWNKEQRAHTAAEEEEEEGAVESGEGEIGQQSGEGQAYRLPSSKHTKKRKFREAEEGEEVGLEGKEDRKGDENQEGQGMSSDIAGPSKDRHERASRIHSSKKPEYIIISSDSE